MNRDILRRLGFNEEVKNVENGICPICKNQVNIKEFKDELSKREFQISGLCMSCQEDIFKGE